MIGATVEAREVTFAEVIEGMVERFGPRGECLDCGQIVTASGICDCYVPFEVEFENFLIDKYADEYGYAA